MRIKILNVGTYYLKIVLYIIKYDLSLTYECLDNLLKSMNALTRRYQLGFLYYFNPRKKIMAMAIVLNLGGGLH